MLAQTALPRPAPLPASPHLKNSFVLQMVQEEGNPKGGRGQWPPTNALPGAPRPHDFLSKCATEGGKKVAWPPHLSSNEDLTASDGEDQPDEEFPSHQQKAHFANQNQSGPNQTTTYPSGFKLREEAPMEHISDVQVVPSQPAFKITQPMRVKADEKWPPREGHMDITSEQVREFTKPKKANRDYSEFFQQNALPNTYPSYRAPPGTQHRTLGEQ